MEQCLIRVTAGLLSQDEATRFIEHESVGALSLFIGTTRDHFEGKKVVRLEYEAYESMALKELSKICQEMLAKFHIFRIAILHRIGHVPVKEASVIVAVSSEHRKDSLAAVEYGIDHLKARVPIWKKERYEDGSSNWKENCECGRRVRENEKHDHSHHGHSHDHHEHDHQHTGGQH